MNFGRVNSGSMAGFLASAISGPIYALLLVIAPFGGDVLDVDVEVGGLLLGLPLMMLFGVVIAGLPSILLGLTLGVTFGDHPMTSSRVAFAAGVGTIGGASVLQSINETGLTAAVAFRGGLVGALTAYVWTRLFDVLRRRSPTVIIDDEPT